MRYPRLPWADSPRDVLLVDVCRCSCVVKLLVVEHFNQSIKMLQIDCNMEFAMY